MSSTYSLRFRLNYQAPGDNLNAWGGVLNAGVFQLLEDALGKRVAISPSASAYTLTTANGASDEARCAFLDVISGTGVAITAPSVDRWYLVRNAGTGDVIITTGAGATATFKPGEIGIAVGDGTNFRKALLTDFGGARLTSLADPIGAQDAATKAYVDATAWQANTGILPGQTGSAGYFLGTNGSVASWQQLSSANLSDTAARDAAALGRAVAMAVAL